MNTPTLIKRPVLTIALILLTAVGAQSATRNFILRIQNNLDDPITINAKGADGYYQGDQGERSMEPTKHGDLTLQFDNRSSISWYEGHLDIDFNDYRIGGSAVFRIDFDRGGIINSVVKNPGNVKIAGKTWDIGATNRIGGLDIELSKAIMGVMAESDQGIGPADHHYVLAFKSNEKLLESNASLILEFANGNEDYEETTNKEEFKRLAFERFQELGWMVEASTRIDYKVSDTSVGSRVSGTASKRDTSDVTNTKRNEQRVKRRLEDGQMRIVAIEVDIMQRLDGTVYPKPHGAPSAIVFKDPQQLVDSYSACAAIKFLPGLKLVSPWKEKSKLQKVLAR